MQYYSKVVNGAGNIFFLTKKLKFIQFFSSGLAKNSVSRAHPYKKRSNIIYIQYNGHCTYIIFELFPPQFLSSQNIPLITMSIRGNVVVLYNTKPISVKSL